MLAAVLSNRLPYSGILFNRSPSLGKLLDQSREHFFEVQMQLIGDYCEGKIARRCRNVGTESAYMQNYSALVIIFAEGNHQRKPTMVLKSRLLS
jgi:hypothetical protein